jgi:cytochrome c-type biogenesis protein CcsB
MHSFLAVLFLFLLAPTLGHANDFCNNTWDDLPVQAQGRVKPYYVLALETTKMLTGKSSVENSTPSKLFCQLSLSYLDTSSTKSINDSINIMTPIDHIDVKKFLSMQVEDKSVALATLSNKKALIRSEIMRLKENNSYKKALTKLFNKVDLYEKVTSGSLWTYVTSSQINQQSNEQSKLNWSPINQLFTTERSTWSKALADSKALYTNTYEDGYLLENTLYKSHIFSIAMLLAIVGILVSVLFKNLFFGQVFAILTILTEVAGITMRVLISGRAPITNMYETVLFSGFGALVIALIISLFKKDRLFILGGLSYNILCLFMMKFAGNMLDESISPLVPVLRDNFWLSTHVTTIMLSYAALALSWMLANFTLIKGRFGYIERKDYRYYEDLVYTCIKVGIILLSAGIILGGVWADYSWGRFWGWDPKETWSLIVLLFYMAVLHGKSTNWMTTQRFISFAATGFLTVMMAWFGVNYILATGLHSYGFSEGGAIFLGSFFLVQVLILIITNFKKTEIITN